MLYSNRKLLSHKKSLLCVPENSHLQYHPMIFLTKKEKTCFQILKYSKHNFTRFPKSLLLGVPCVLVRTFQRNRTSRMCVYRERFIISNLLKDFPGTPVVKTPCFQCRGVGSIPGQGTKIPHAMQYVAKKEKKKRICSCDYGGWHVPKSARGLQSWRPWYARGLETQEELMIQFESEGRKRCVPVQVLRSLLENLALF